MLVRDISIFVGSIYFLYNLYKKPYLPKITHDSVETQQNYLPWTGPKQNPDTNFSRNAAKCWLKMLVKTHFVYFLNFVFISAGKNSHINLWHTALPTKTYQQLELGPINVHHHSHANGIFRNYRTPNCMYLEVITRRVAMASTSHTRPN